MHKVPGIVSSKLIENSKRIEPSSDLSNCRVGVPFGGVFQKPFKFGCPSGVLGVVLPSIEHPTHGILAATFCCAVALVASAKNTAAGSKPASREWAFMFGR